MRIEPVVPRPRKKRNLPSRRYAVIGGIGLVLLGILFFRLWSLQIVTGDKYLAEANQNRTREIRVPAPRGRILDREGNVLVDNRTSMALQLDPIEIPTEPAARRELFTRVGEVLGHDAEWVRRKYRDSIENDPPGSPITLDQDVDDEIVYYLQEHQADFPEVQINRIFVRKYPQGLLGAHILGSVGEVTAEDLEENPDKDLAAGDTLGQTGIEMTYDDELRGSPGLTRLQVDSTGRIISQLPSSLPEPGDSVRLSIDQGVQLAGESSLQSIGLPGAFVVMDVKTGEVLGLGSNPTFDPSIFTKPLTQQQVDDLYDEDLDAPLFDRAIGGQYAVGSIFKPVTALAGLDAGLITPSTVVNDAGTITIADQPFDNAGKTPHGPVDLRRSLEVSSDVYYYILGRDMNGTRQLQNWAGDFGFGRATGIDIPGESEGLIPTPKWVNEAHAEQPEFYDRWAIGQNVQFAIGQGYFQASPLQMAVAYSALGNGGTVLRPKLMLQTEDAAGRVVSESEPEVTGEVPMDPADRQVIMEGLHDAAQSPEGTSYKVFGGFPVKIAGKTGTSERTNEPDQSWYAALAPYDDPEIAVVVTVERGGFGADTAAPVTLQILQEYFGKQARAVSGGTGSVE
ncbi:MAG: penicillin-binding protein 2 [Solirubrobacterales bacterium]|nr:penicillin-binding protein 2 [Solirubrobacterales bacterium]